jgi:DNA repair protein RadC
MTRGTREPTAVEPTTPPPRAWPDKLAQPARRALANAGFTRLEQLSAVSEAELAHLHGIGPNALAQLRQALAGHSLSFAATPRKHD